MTNAQNDYIMYKYSINRIKRINGENVVMTKAIDRREARQHALELLFEQGFRKDEDASDIYRTAEDIRDFKTDELTEKLYFGVLDNLDEIDGLISTRAVGWKTGRMSKVSLSVLRIAVYEMKFCPKTPFQVVINEAVELAKTFDDDKAPAFVNGILNGIAEDLGLKK